MSENCSLWRLVSSYSVSRDSRVLLAWYPLGLLARGGARGDDGSHVLDACSHAELSTASLSPSTPH